jgi:hypothetical protein
MNQSERQLWVQRIQRALVELKQAPPGKGEERRQAEGISPAGGARGEHAAG